jgi:hypothetical protein
MISEKKSRIQKRTKKDKKEIRDKRGNKVNRTKRRILEEQKDIEGEDRYLSDIKEDKKDILKEKGKETQTIKGEDRDLSDKKEDRKDIERVRKQRLSEEGYLRNIRI